MMCGQGFQAFSLVAKPRTDMTAGQFASHLGGNSGRGHESCHICVLLVTFQSFALESRMQKPSVVWTDDYGAPSFCFSGAKGLISRLEACFLGADLQGFPGPVTTQISGLTTTAKR